MPILTLGSRAVLALVFGVAGLAKLLNVRGTAQMLVEFGVPATVAAPLAPILATVELAVAAALLPATTSRSGAAAALLLLITFSAAAALAIGRGRRVQCQCFGQLGTAAVGIRTLVRNAVLAGLAAGVVLGQRGSPAPRFGALVAGLQGAGLGTTVFGAAELGLVLVMAWGFIHLVRAHGRLLLRVDELERRLAAAGLAPGSAAHEIEALGLPPGTPAPPLTATDLEGRTWSWSRLLESGRPVLLLLTTPSCAPCRALLPRVAAWQRDDAARLRVVIASDGSIDEIRRDAIDFRLADVLMDKGLRLLHAFGGTSTPSAVRIRPDGTIGSLVATGPDAIAALHSRMLSDSAPASPTPPRAGLTPGTPVPALPRAALDDGTRVLAELIQSETLVVFWNPGCGHCRSMREALQRSERRRGKGARPLVIVSAGDEASVRAEGFFSPVLLDPDFSLGRALGIGGTPMAVLVDAEARVASHVVAGADAVLSLAGGSAPNAARSG